MHVTV